MSSTSLAFTLCVVFVAASALTVGANPLADKLQLPNVDDDKLPMGPDGSLFLAGQDCGPDEFLAVGQLPMCEPTCANPRPICPKVFFSGVDYVPCFCKAPLVRNTATRQCIPLSECPPQMRGPGVLQATKPQTL